MNFGAVQDGKLRVYKWPSMENIVDQADAHTSVKDLDFRFIEVLNFNLSTTSNMFYGRGILTKMYSIVICSPDGKFLASVGSGPCRIWDVSKSISAASLMKENVRISINGF